MAVYSTTETCTVDGCDKPRGPRTWCQTHYARWYNHGDVRWTPKRGRQPCIVDDCVRPRERGGGYCGTHYYRVEKHGSPHVVTGQKRGADHPRWAGGRQVTVDGYVRVTDPATGARIMEHRLVMEQQLGRRLYEGENVHHRNGVRDDNRPENLELWVTYQPKGQRPADLVEWAEEVLRRYGRSDQD